MEKKERELLDNLEAKAFAESGLDDIDHRKLTRLIAEADAKELLITGVLAESAVIRSFSPGAASRLSLAAPNKKKGGTANEQKNASGMPILS